MGSRSGVFESLREFFWSDPLMAVAIAAALFALATTPLAFAVLARMEWFKSRRGRVMQRPEFWSVVCSMMLVMGIPAIFAGLVLKSRYYDTSRYEFDPNRTISVLDQGRQFEDLRLERSLYQADEAIRDEMKRLADERKHLVESVKAIDETIGNPEVARAMQAVGAQSPGAAKSLSTFFEELGGIRQSVGLDAPQQIEDLTAPLVQLASAPPGASGVMVPAVNVPSNVPPPASPTGSGLGSAEVQIELASVPEPQRKIAEMLPLSDVPEGLVIGKSGDRHLETFNAENLFEKIDGRAESFIQYDVKGMAYAYYHPEGDDGSEAQVYIFEMGGPLKALGKYGSEKPEEFSPVELGDEGYTSAGSVFFRSGPYYVQVITTTADPKLAAIAEDLARRVAAKTKPASAAGESVAGTDGSGDAGKTTSNPDDLFKLLPEGPEKSSPKYVAQDVFGYSFLSDVFMADYKDGDITWQGFIRPFESPEDASKVLEEYLSSARTDGAEIKMIEDSAADQMVVSSNFGLVDVLFVKGNALAGANGALDAPKAEAFARKFAETLKPPVPTIETSGSGSSTEGSQD